MKSFICKDMRSGNHNIHRMKPFICKDMMRPGNHRNEKTGFGIIR